MTYDDKLKDLLVSMGKAEKLGMVFPLKKGKYQISKFILETEELQVQVNTYDVTTWTYPKHDKNNHGHTMLSTWTKQGAEQMQGIIDLHIADANEKRWTEIKVCTWAISKSDIDFFIKRHGKTPFKKA